MAAVARMIDKIRFSLLFQAVEYDFVLFFSRLCMVVDPVSLQSIFSAICGVAVESVDNGSVLS